MEPIENFWEMILSRNPDDIRRAFKSVSLEEQEFVLAHLEKMATEEGWHADQKASAMSALQCLKMQKKL